jgi:hypothetical protein
MMTEAEADRALVRISKAMFAIGAGGTILAFGWRGWTWGTGFAMGAILSWLSFRALKRMVDALGGKRPARSGVAVLAGLRYLLLGGGAYAILKYSQISVIAVLVGLFVSAAAVIVEIFIQLVYARN